MSKAVGASPRPWEHGVRTWGRGQFLGCMAKDVRAYPNPNPKAVEA